MILTSAVLALICVSSAGLATLVGQLRVSSAVTRWTVVDSTSADGYSAWQGNVKGASWEVRIWEVIMRGRGSRPPPERCRPNCFPTPNTQGSGVGLAPPKLLKFYFWDLQNEDDVLSSAAKPVLAEIGPLAYRESWQRFDVKFTHGGRDGNQRALSLKLTTGVRVCPRNRAQLAHRHALAARSRDLAHHLPHD